MAAPLRASPGAPGFGWPRSARHSDPGGADRGAALVRPSWALPPGLPPSLSPFFPSLSPFFSTPPIPCIGRWGQSVPTVFFRSCLLASSLLYQLPPFSSCPPLLPPSLPIPPMPPTSAASARRRCTSASRTASAAASSDAVSAPSSAAPRDRAEARACEGRLGRAGSAHVLRITYCVLRIAHVLGRAGSAHVTDGPRLLGEVTARAILGRRQAIGLRLGAALRAKADLVGCAHHS
jgi:hypothetical protein